MSVTGGANLRRFIREAKAQPAEAIIEVGFKDRRIAPLAHLHEFGSRYVPERPAFRAGARRAEEVWTELTGKFRSPGPTHEQWVEIAIALRDVIRESYMNFHGQPLSERQRQRKEGTPFQDDQLIGHEGPKLVSHIHAYVNSEQVD